MKLRLDYLIIDCESEPVRIDFSDFNFFHGEMGTGKSTIARLIDYCMGSRTLEMTPALQTEFVSATLCLWFEDSRILVERAKGRNIAEVVWGDRQFPIPVLAPNGPVLPNEKFEILSDFFCYLLMGKIPKVRKSQAQEDSGLQRLSWRNFMWFCYLDQASMDSSFFELDPEAHHHKRLASRNVLRLLLGFHQEQVAELEEELEQTKNDRHVLEQSSELIQGILSDAGYHSLEEVNNRIAKLQSKLGAMETKLASYESNQDSDQIHYAEKIRSKARTLTDEIDSVALAIDDLEKIVAGDERHRNEILNLSVKVQRVEGARAVLNGVDFEQCPRCTQPLPKRSSGMCSVCGQPEESTAPESLQEQIKDDVAARIRELDEIIRLQKGQIIALQHRRTSLLEAKSKLESELTQVMTEYDSTYLSNNKGLIREIAELKEELGGLEKAKALPARMQGMKEEILILQDREDSLKSALEERRLAAEADLTSLEKLKSFFLDSLVKSRVLEIGPDDKVKMASPTFLPEIVGEAGFLTTISFGNLGSGGKKNLFKCCFALAIHRFAAATGVTLPTFLIIDSPMKNISEEINREQFEAFYSHLYDLAGGELVGTQFIVMDKQFFPPIENQVPAIRERLMSLDDAEHPPLLPFYSAA